MNKAKIVLSVIALLAIVSGTIAFKASKYTGIHVFTSTSAYTFGQRVYTTDESYCIQPSLKFATTVIANTATVLTTPAAIASAGSAVFVSGPFSVTLPTYNCAGLPVTTTYLTNAN